MGKKLKIADEIYSLKQCQDIYKRILHYKSLVNQWQNHHDFENLEIASKYHQRLICLLEFLENITVFHVGLGFNINTTNVNKRIASFKFLKVD